MNNFAHDKLHQMMIIIAKLTWASCIWPGSATDHHEQTKKRVLLLSHTKLLLGQQQMTKQRHVMQNEKGRHLNAVVAYVTPLATADEAQYDGLMSTPLHVPQPELLAASLIAIFGVLICAWTSSEPSAFALIADTLHTQPFFDTALVRGLFDEVPKLDPDARAVAEAPLLSVVSTCLLQQRFGLQA